MYDRCQWLTIDLSCSGFIAGNCCARRQVLWKRSKKAESSTVGPGAGTSQNRSENRCQTEGTKDITTKKNVLIEYVLAKNKNKNIIAPTWAWEVRPRTKLLMLRLELPQYLRNAGFIY